MPEIPPSRTTSGSRSGDAFNRVVENARSHQPVSSPGVGHTVHGIYHAIDEEPQGGYASHIFGAWRKAATGYTYDKDNGYTEGEIVVVLPSASIVTTGAASADDAGATVMASGGIWVALQDVSPVLHSTGPDVYWYHIPKLPMPDETDMDSTSNYWMQIKSLC